MVFFVSLTGLFFVIILGVLFGPVVISCKGTRTSSFSSFSMEFYWLHPLALRGAFDVMGKTVDLRLFNRFRIVPLKGKEKKTPPPEAGAENAPAASPYLEEPRGDHYSFTEEKGPQRGSPEQATYSRDSASARAEPYIKRLYKRLKGRVQGIVEKIKGIALQRAVFFLRQHAWLVKLFRWLWRGLGSLFGLCSVRSYTIHVRVGFSEPSETGKLFGYWMGVKNALSLDTSKKRRVFLEPMFNEECFEIRGAVSLQTSVARFVALAFVLAITFPYFTTLRVWRAYPR